MHQGIGGSGSQARGAVAGAAEFTRRERERWAGGQCLSARRSSGGQSREKAGNRGAAAAVAAVGRMAREAGCGGSRRGRWQETADGSGG